METGLMSRRSKCQCLRLSTGLAKNGITAKVGGEGRAKRESNN